VPLTALLILDDSDSAFAILGVPLVEFQIRRALATGVTHVVLTVGRLPPALLAAIDRLRREGIGIDVARTVTDAIDFVHPDDRVLVMAPRVSVSADDARNLAVRKGNIVLATTTTTETAQLDIIDAGRRWTGWAAFEGRVLRDVGAMIGDWDLAPTILRRLLQTQAEVMASNGPPSLLDKPEDRHALERSLLADSEAAPDGLGTALVSKPAARLLARIASDAGLRPDWIRWGAVATATAAVALAFGHLIALPAAIMLGALVGWRASDTLGRAIGAGRRAGRFATLFWGGATLAVLAAFGRTVMETTGQWGCVLLALALAAALGLLRTPLARERNTLVLADTESSLIVLGLAALLGLPLWGLALATAHVTASVAARQLFVVPPQA
jgi:hypothetical protein